MVNNNSTANLSYFAASNGFSGFSSIFNYVFSPDKFKHIFILKGGPGTGKSTLMKKVINYAYKNGIYSEAIYCSSDPNSLDGVILEDNDEKIAIIDGTSPHTVDPKYPIAAESIINLADGIDKGLIIEKRDEIFFLNSEKSKAYTKAYDLLKIAGSMHNYIIKAYKALIDEREITKFANDVINTYATNKTYKTVRCYHISSFSKYGYTQLSDDYTNLKGISFFTDGFIEEITLKKISELMNNRHMINTICPSPFSENIIDAIYTDNYIFKSRGDSEIKINLSDLVVQNCSLTEEKRIYSNLLELSREQFAIASDYHFKLEKIYSEAINFKHNDKIYDNLIKEIESFLS